MKQSRLQTGITTLSTMGAASVARMIPLTKIVGSSWAWFSAAAGIYPAVGYMSGFSGALSLSMVRLALHLLYTPVSVALLTVYHIPTLIASTYAACMLRPDAASLTTRLLLSGILLSCMGLFVAHPTGTSAFVYTLPWLLPLALLWIPTSSRFLLSLGTVYSAHAVGSVAWIWCMPALSASTWISLLPCACAERVILASVLCSVCALYDYVVAPSAAPAQSPSA